MIGLKLQVYNHWVNYMVPDQPSIVPKVGHHPFDQCFHDFYIFSWPHMASGLSWSLYGASKQRLQRLTQKLSDFPPSAQRPPPAKSHQAFGWNTSQR